MTGAATAPELTVAEIVARLTGRIDSLCASVLPGGQRSRDGRRWQMPSRRQGGPGDSYYVVLEGPRKGHWSHWAAGAGGDALDLVEYELRLSKRDAVAWAKGWLGIDGDRPVPRPAPRPAVLPESALRAERERIARAAALWSPAVPVVPGEPAHAYLAGRRLVLPGPLPSTLRCVRSLAVPKLELDDPDGLRFPALLGALQAPGGQFAGVWRIFVAPDGAGKAPVRKAKLGLGRARGAAVRLAPAALRLGLAEGIETALAVMVRFGVACWACLSAGGLADVVLPGLVREVVLFPDADLAHARPARGDDGAPYCPLAPDVYWPGPDAAARAAERFQAEGRRVTWRPPPLGLDWADVLMREDA